MKARGFILGDVEYDDVLIRTNVRDEISNCETYEQSEKKFSKATFVRLYITSAVVEFMLRVCNVKEFRQVLAT